MNLYGQDMDETTNPFESGLTWTIDLKDPRDFIGKKALLEMPIRQQLFGLLLEDRGMLRNHQEVFTRYNENGDKNQITSGGFSPTLNRSIALARLPSKITIGDEVQVLVRDKN